MSKFAHDGIKPYQDKDSKKNQQVAEMFNSVAFRYDFMNRFLSAGIDMRWRKKAIYRLKNYNPQYILDVATGTGDVAIMMAKMLQPRSITGIDISVGMLNVGLEKINKSGLNDIITLQQGDSEALPFKDNNFDAVTVAFGVRNFAHLETGMQEIYRVLRPGGKLVVLEFSQPKQLFFKGFYKMYMNVVTPGIGKMIARNRAAYQYLNDSIKAFPERENYVQVLNSAGFVNTSYKPLTMGICCLYEGTK